MLKFVNNSFENTAVNDLGAFGFNMVYWLGNLLNHFHRSSGLKI